MIGVATCLDCVQWRLGNAVLSIDLVEFVEFALILVLDSTRTWLLY